MKQTLKHITLLLCMLCMTAGVLAQQEEFFDPTRKKAKVREPYEFSMTWRLQAGYIQNWQHSNSTNVMNPYLHGMQLGATVDFNLPLRFSVQSGLLYGITYGRIDQHWPATTLEAQHTDGDYVRHNIMEHQLSVPVRAFYRQPLWRELALFFYGGPQFTVGLAQPDYVDISHLTDTYGSVIGTKEMLEQMGVPTEKYDRYQNGDLYRFNFQLGVGGGLEWAQYRLQAGYDFGLNNLIKHKYVSGQHMWEWGWYVSFAYKLRVKN